MRKARDQSDGRPAAVAGRDGGATATELRRQRVLVAGFPGALGSGLREAIAGDPELHVVGTGDRGDVRASITEHGPDVVLLDHGLLGSVMELRRLVVAYPNLGVVVGVTRLSRRRDDSLLAAGARIVVPLTIELLALRGVLKLVAWRLVGVPGVGRKPSGKPLDRLTEREHQVFQMLVRRRRAQDIADELQIAIATVNTHTRRIYEKLGVHSRAELLAHASEGEFSDDPQDDSRLLSRERVSFGRRSAGSAPTGRPGGAELRTALGVRRWLHPV